MDNDAENCFIYVLSFLLLYLKSVQFHCTKNDWIVCSLLFNFLSSLYILDIYLLLHEYLAVFVPVSKLPFHGVDCFFGFAEAFHLDVITLLNLNAQENSTFIYTSYMRRLREKPSELTFSNFSWLYIPGVLFEKGKEKSSRNYHHMLSNFHGLLKSYKFDIIIPIRQMRIVRFSDIK